MDNKRYQGDNLDGAISEACAELGIPSDKLRYKIVQEGSKGLFGLGLIGAKKFIIEISDDSKEPVKGDKKPAAHFEKPNRDKSDKPKTDRAKNDNPQNDKPRKPVKNENVDNSDKNAVKSEQKQSDRKNNNRDRQKDRPRRFDKEQGSNTADAQSRQERRETESRRKSGADFNNNGASKSEVKPDNRSEQPARRYEKTGEVTGDPVKTAEEFLTSLFKSMEMNISYSGEFKNENNELVVNLSGEDMGVLIGKRGQTLDALQYLTSQVVNKHQTAYIRVKIDTENYRERRKETMESLAQNIALKVKKTHKPVALEPMNPYERRIIHSYLQNDKEIITKSEGVEPYRHVIVCPVKKRKTYGQRNKDNVIAEESENTELKLTESIINTENVSEIKANDEQTANNVETRLTMTETKVVEVKLEEALTNVNTADTEALTSSAVSSDEQSDTADEEAKTEA